MQDVTKNSVLHNAVRGDAVERAGIAEFGFPEPGRALQGFWSAASRVYWVKIVVALGFILGLLLTPKLWLSSRSYPLTPVLDFLPPIPLPADWVILLALLGLLAATIWSARPRPFIWACVALVSLLVFLDQSRLQPWVYQYTVTLAALGVFTWRGVDIDGRDAALNVCRFMVASMYVWSGLQKANPEFIGNIFPWMIEPLSRLFPPFTQPAFYVFGMLVPAIETAIGIGLLTNRFRNAAIWLALAMCAFVLFTLGPLGHNFNNVVWPWNVTLAVLVVLLFARTQAVPLRDILWVRNHAFHKIVLVVFGLLPALYFFNAWDAYPAWSLYSGTTDEAVINMKDEVKRELPDGIRQYVQSEAPDDNWLDPSDWTYGELNVPPYSEVRVYKNVARTVCRYARDPQAVVLVMYGRLSWFNGNGRQELNCAQLD
jgi:hypothetical protein